MTILSMVQRVLRRLKEDEAKKVTSLGVTLLGHWTVEEVLNRINEVSQDIVNDTECLVTTTTVDSVASSGTYTTSASIGKILGITYNNKPLGETSVDKMNHYERMGWIPSPWRESVAGTGAIPKVWIPGEGSGQFMLYEMPLSAVVEGIVIHGTAIPGEFDTTSDPATLPMNGVAWLTPHHRTIIYGVLADCYEEDNNIEMGAYYVAKYELEKAKIGRKARRMRDPMPSFEHTMGDNGVINMSRDWSND